jgi:hypothetical protein
MSIPHIDPETGYDDNDPRDAPEPEEESDLKFTCCPEFPNCDCAAISSELSRIHGVGYIENE